MEETTIYNNTDNDHEVDITANSHGVTIYEAETGSINYADTVWLSREEAIAAAKAILAWAGECEK